MAGTYRFILLETQPAGLALLRLSDTHLANTLEPREVQYKSRGLQDNDKAKLHTP